MRSSSNRASAILLSSIAGIVFFTGSQQAFADVHATNVPQLSSKPGAAYTMYINMAGFNYDGLWAGSTPGNSPSLGNTAPEQDLSANALAQAKVIYSAMANHYASFNVNVTTVDPYNATNDPTPTDSERLDYYDVTAKFAQIIVGPTGPVNWHGGADGLAGGAMGPGNVGHGGHTTWMFTDGFTNFADTTAAGLYIASVASHETGHTLGMNHQNDYNTATSTKVNEYGAGDLASGPGSYATIMGDGSGKQRDTWRAGHSSADGDYQNDVQRMLTIPLNDGYAYATSGNGHTRATATPLALSGTNVNFNSARGVITPVSSTDPQPIGIDNYTKDVFSFTLSGLSTISLVLHDGNDLATPGVADEGATLRSILNIYNSLNGAAIATGIEDISTLFSTYAGLLGAGTYYAEITSFGGHKEISDPAYQDAFYFDMGTYFLTGSIVAVPEPGMVCVFAIGVVGILRRRRGAAN